MLNEKRIMELKGIYGNEWCDKSKDLLFKKNKSIDGRKFNLSLKKGGMNEKEYNKKMGILLLEKDELKEFKELLEGGKNNKRYEDYNENELKEVSLSFIEKGVNSLLSKKNRYVDNNRLSEKEIVEFNKKLEMFKEIRNDKREKENGFIKNEEVINLINKIEKLDKVSKEDIIKMLENLIKKEEV